ncbi:MAG: phospholipid carrier-dependent glycosyltransferase [Caldilineaceae bacterium]|nr:phospholipid carrier-dependent glycosyltransferase [Caldilineaceae bacterium]
MEREPGLSVAGSRRGAALAEGAQQSGERNWQNTRLATWPYLRLGVVLVASATVALVFLLVRTLFGATAGFIGGLLLALDPWYLAHSRVLHHDGLMAGFMLLASLALLGHLWRGPRPIYLIGSGVCAGLALLSKTLALFLLPWVGLVFIVALWQRRGALVQLLIDGIIWAASLGLTFFALWPGMWLRPLNTLWKMAAWPAAYSVVPHAQGQFFMGKAVSDPGLFFYPVVGLLALTPLVLIGLVWLVVRLGSSIGRTDSAPREERMPLALMALYCAGYVVAITLAAKKQDRYLLPALLMVQVLAAVGLARLLATVATLLDRISPDARWLRPRRLLVSWIALLLSLQAVTALPHHPYYRTYANPLVGGIQSAAKWVNPGSGEGYDRVAAYLNGLPDAEKLHVVTVDPSLLSPFFHGHTDGWSRGGEIFQADYVVLYRPNVQRGHPDGLLTDYIRCTWPRVHTVVLHGLEVAWVYRAPQAQWAAIDGEELWLSRDKGLLAISASSQPGRAESAQTIRLTLYRILHRQEEAQWTVARGQGSAPSAAMTAVVSQRYHVQGETVIEDVFELDVEIVSRAPRQLSMSASSMAKRRSSGCSPICASPNFQHMHPHDPHHSQHRTKEKLYATIWKRPIIDRRIGPDAGRRDPIGSLCTSQHTVA